MHNILRSRTSDGLIPLHANNIWQPRIDLCACVNVLTLFACNGQLHDLSAVLNWIYSCLEHRVYLDDLSVYTVDAFFYFLSRLIRNSAVARKTLQPIFQRRLSERLGSHGDSLALGMRVIAAASVGLIDEVNCERLLSMQREDGSWTNARYFRDPKSSVTIGNDGLATAMAIRAISVVTALKAERQSLK